MSEQGSPPPPLQTIGRDRSEVKAGIEERLRGGMQDCFKLFEQLDYVGGFERFSELLSVFEAEQIPLLDVRNQKIFRKALADLYSDFVRLYKRRARFITVTMHAGEFPAKPEGIEKFRSRAERETGWRLGEIYWNLYANEKGELDYPARLGSTPDELEENKRRTALRSAYMQALHQTELPKVAEMIKRPLRRMRTADIPVTPGTVRVNVTSFVDTAAKNAVGYAKLAHARNVFNEPFLLPEQEDEE